MKPPPPNYIPGIGRGATGFTTRSDIGPAKASTTIGRVDEKEEEYDQNFFDDFEGNDLALFASSSDYDQDDEEADLIYKSVDNHIASRRKHKTEARSKQENENYKALNPSITEQFSGAKRKLYELSMSDWASIPEITTSRCNKKKINRFESFVPVPDTMLEKARQEKKYDLTAVGEGKGIMLSMKLDKLSDSVSGLTAVDPKGYLSDLKSVDVRSVSDFEKVRLLLKSICQKNPLGWIAAVQLEENAGKIGVARGLIKKGCEECPKNEDLWLKACSLAKPGDAKGVIARGVTEIPRSVKLWMQAADLEHDMENRSRVLRKALERIPESVRLWEAVVELANEEDARLLLHRAVECCPFHVKLWLALARLETYENAKDVLNKARKKISREPAIWIAEAKLEEANDNTAMVGGVIEEGIRSLQRGWLEFDREVWMKEAEVAERAGSVMTCQAIVCNTIGIGVEDIDRKRTWVADAEEFIERGFIETARAIYAHALTVFKTKKSIWLKAAQLEKSHGTRESLEALLRKSVTYMPQAEVLWLMGAKEKWLAGDIPVARAILQEAYAAIPNSEEIWLAAFKLEFENHETERARMLIAKARERGGTERVWMKSAIIEREVGNTMEERRLLEEGIQRFPSFFKLWLMLGQLEDRLGRLEEAKGAYYSGLKHCPSCNPLWLSLANLEEKLNGLNKARAILTVARKKNPKNAELWLAAVRAEFRHGDKKEADALMSKALQECPTSGIMWAASIEMAPRPQRKTKCRDAYNMCRHDPHVIAATAKLLWQDRKLDKARNWLNKVVTLAPDIGDLWALYYRFELQHGNEELQKDVLKRCIVAEPKHGERWQAISKSVENSHQPLEAILKKTVVALGKGENAVESAPRAVENFHEHMESN